jgi:His-Xaa-Ser system protein HxsD
MEIHKDKKYVIISVNPKIYPMDMIFSAAYIFIDRAYVIVDGDPNEEIIVQLKAKDKGIDLEKMAREFNTELVNYSFYQAQYVRNNPVREAIIQRAFFTQSAEPQTVEQPQEKADYIEDIEKIAKPWKSKGMRRVGKDKGRKRKSKSRDKS